MFHRLFKVNAFILGLAVLLAIDEQLPTLTYDDHVIDEWTSVRRVKGRTYYIPYVKTRHFTFALPGETNASINFAGRQMVVEASPLFRIPTRAHVNYDGHPAQFEPARTVYSFPVPFHYIILIFAGVAVAFRRHNSLAFQLAFAPPLLAVLGILMFYVLT